MTAGRDDRLAVIQSRDLDQVLLYRAEGPVSVGVFIAQAQQLSARLGSAQHVLNLFQDRYRFMLGLVASALAGKVSLLPSTYTRETLAQLYADFPDTLCLHDQDDWPDRLLNLRYRMPPALAPAGHIPTLPDDQVIARVFTSGSTGQPVAHPKTWGRLVRNVQAAARQLGLDRAPVSLVGTVPPQHMYGFESTVLLCLLGGCPLWSGKPFYPADITGALAALPEPRMLVTTPYHLQALLDAQIPIPATRRLLLATAPLPPALAERAEQCIGAVLLEIYGSTETGQIATRRPTDSPAWELFPGVSLDPAGPADEGLFLAGGGHIEQPVQLSDHLAMRPDGRFLLLGRVADQVNIAGKRSSLAFLRAQLQRIPGVQDGVFFLPANPRQGTGPEVCRVAALVVAPALSVAQILAQLRERIDAVFLPRPLIPVDRLPYNATGKLPQPALQAQLDRYLAGEPRHAD